MRSGVISLLSDFGLRDPYAGIIKGVILGINPEVNIVDLVHLVEPQDIQTASFLLATCVDWFPRGTVHVAVVDPGVGSNRRAIAIQGEKHFYVGPDNGVFTLALRRDKPVGMVELRPNPESAPIISSTFHGRDIFAPAAARISNGVALENMGTIINDYYKLELEQNTIGESTAQTAIIHEDSFGNLITLLHTSDLKQSVESVHIAGHDIPLRQTYAEVAQGEFLAYWGSSNYLEIAVNRGSAREALGVKVGDHVDVKLARR